MSLHGGLHSQVATSKHHSPAQARPWATRSPPRPKTAACRWACPLSWSLLGPQFPLVGTISITPTSSLDPSSHLPQGQRNPLPYKAVEAPESPTGLPWYPPSGRSPGPPYLCSGCRTMCLEGFLRVSGGFLGRRMGARTGSELWQGRWECLPRWVLPACLSVGLSVPSPRALLPLCCPTCPPVPQTPECGWP